ncbi:hypothetical protein J5N97_023433 [Dioscorea zingiberensis]|uniref:F-box domain-containing protein n=1 Tax=Dioscorea zingiberensis TaxID=325984 RepID=A0A9D5C4V4_9LILI|nr:hypothetical protein J5N97_023433 [Dioscorea zingiberensis]
MAEMAGVDFSRLPEGCISHVLSLTSPRDVCRAAMVSPEFRSAETSDTVWERFLPSDIADILSRAVDRVEYSSKRELFFRLCDPILIDGGKRSFFLEKSTGRKCYMLSARQLTIIWGDTPQYWAWISVPESRFSEVAELLHVCWLEIHGRLDTKELSWHTKYVAYLVFKLTEGCHGFRHPSHETSVKVGTHVSSHHAYLLTAETERVPSHHHDSSQTIDTVARPHARRYGRRWFRPSFGHVFQRPDSFLQEPGNLEFESTETTTSTRRSSVRVPHQREDGWMEIELGEFDNELGEDGEVEMSLLEVKGGHWKSGLLIQGIEIRPRN